MSFPVIPLEQMWSADFLVVARKTLAEMYLPKIKARNRENLQEKLHAKYIN